MSVIVTPLQRLKQNASSFLMNPLHPFLPDDQETGIGGAKVIRILEIAGARLRNANTTFHLTAAALSGGADISDAAASPCNAPVRDEHYAIKPTAAATTQPGQGYYSQGNQLPVGAAGSEVMEESFVAGATEAAAIRAMRRLRLATHSRLNSSVNRLRFRLI